MSSPTVFVSYSHKDKEWLEQLIRHLRVYEKDGLLDLWDDRRIQAGGAWREDIHQAIDAAQVAILLISTDFLISDFIRKEEVPRLLERRRQDGLHVFPVIVFECDWQELDWLRTMQVRPWEGKPLASFRTKNKRESEMKAIAREVRQLLVSQRLGFAGQTTKKARQSAHRSTIKSERISSPPLSATKNLNQSPASIAPQKPEPSAVDSKKTYVFAHLITHLDEADDWARMSDLLESRSFLEDKANHFGTFEHVLYDIETHILPAAIRHRDWTRFLRYALVAINVRGLTEAMASDDIVCALVHHGDLELALDVAAQHPDAVRRVRLRILAASALRRGSPHLLPLLERIREDCEHLPPPRDEESARSHMEMLGIAAHRLGPDLSPTWEKLAAQLMPWPYLMDRVYIAAAQGWLEQDSAVSEGFWKSICQVQSERALLNFLPFHLPASADSLAALNRLGLLPLRDERVFWYTCAAVLGNHAARDIKEASAHWDQYTEGRSIPWSAELIEAGRGLFGRLEPSRLARIVDCIEDPVAQAALWVVALEMQSDRQAAERAFWILDQIPAEAQRMHWTLRYLRAWPERLTPEKQQLIRAVLAALAGRGQILPVEDVPLLLDLVAEHLPQELPQQMQNVIQDPGTQASILRTIPDKSSRAEVLTHLFEHIDEYASVIVAAESEASQLRNEVLIQVTCRLCSIWGHLLYFKRALDRMPTLEEDRLRAAVASMMATAGRAELAIKVCDGMRSPRRRVHTLLSVSPSQVLSPGFLKPAKLYEAMASVDAVEDEILTLRTFLELSSGPRDLVRRYAEYARTRTSSRRSTGSPVRPLLSFEEPFQEERQDREGAVELIHHVIAVGFDECDPDDGPRGERIAAAFTKAAERLVMFTAVPWPARAHALEWLLSRIIPVFLPEGFLPPEHRCHQLAVLIKELVTLPARLERGQARSEVRRHWHEMLPLLIAYMERLLDLVRDRLVDRLQKWPRPDDLINLMIDREVDVLPPSLEYVLPPRQRLVLELCLADPKEREQRAESLLAEEYADPAGLRALIYLLSRQRPQVVPMLVERVTPPPSPAWDDLSLRLIRDHWVQEREAKALLDEMENVDARLQAEFWIGLQLQSNPEVSLRSIAALVGGRGLAPFDPATEPMLVWFLEADPEQSRAALADATLEALRRGGHRRGEAALELWLHAHLKEATPQVLAEVQAALQQALTLSSSHEETS